MILVRYLETPDKTRLYSRHRHDFVTYKDTLDGKEYMLDGGPGEYYRTYGRGKVVEVTSNDPFNVIREEFARYNMYSKSYVKLKDMSDKWLQNLLDWFIEHNYEESRVFRVYLEEKLYRAENELFIEEDTEYLEYDH